MDYLPILAISISCLSLGASYYVLFRDRAKLKIRAQIFVDSRGQQVLEILIVNIGRRPQYLAWIGQRLGRSNSRVGIVPYSFENVDSPIKALMNHTIETPLVKLDEGGIVQKVHTW